MDNLHSSSPDLIEVDAVPAAAAADTDSDEEDALVDHFGLVPGWRSGWRRGSGGNDRLGAAADAADDEAPTGELPMMYPAYSPIDEMLLPGEVRRGGRRQGQRQCGGKLAVAVGIMALVCLTAGLAAILTSSNGTPRCAPAAHPPTPTAERHPPSHPHICRQAKSSLSPTPRADLISRGPLCVPALQQALQHDPTTGSRSSSWRGSPTRPDLAPSTTGMIKADIKTEPSDVSKPSLNSVYDIRLKLAHLTQELAVKPTDI